MRFRRQNPAAIPAIAGLLSIALVGCHHNAILSVDDAIVAAGDRELTLTAYVQDQDRLGLRHGIRGREVAFYLSGRQVAAAKTDREGRADATVQTSGLLPGEFQVRSAGSDPPLTQSGHIHFWDDRKVIIAIDVDETLSETDFETLLLEERDDESDPLDDAPETLCELARDFHLLYLTARPRFLIEKTRDWLSENEFPLAPLICARHWRKSLTDGKFKSETLAALRRRFPNILIGVGDTRSDANAYARNGLLPIIILDEATDEVEDNPPPGALVFDDWEELGDYFKDHIKTLRDPDSLRRSPVFRSSSR